MTSSDTIFALSSGAGRAAVAVLRLSGPGSSMVLTALAGGLPAPRHLVPRVLRDPQTSEILDKAAVVWLPGPRSFTGEDVAELHLHGSPAVLGGVMAVLRRYTGIRPAEAGEFTRRAFANGKMDLVEVEGLSDLLSAQTGAQRRQAIRQMSGMASSVFEGWRRQLLEIRAGIEAVVDFADEPGVAAEAGRTIDADIRRLLGDMRDCMAASAASEVVRDGVRLVLAGYPNTGKSSLLNSLAGRDAAIVSDRPGTTRDVIEVMLDLKGVAVMLTDTAGLRGAVDDEVEAEGVRRSRRQMEAADMVLWVSSPDVAGSETPEPGLTPALYIRNKSDLTAGESIRLRNESQRPNVTVSTRRGAGMDDLINQISNLVSGFGGGDSALLVSVRQKSIAEESIRFLNDSLSAASEALEVKAECIRLASESVGRLTGRVDVEEWLGAIFSRFCIGK